MDFIEKLKMLKVKAVGKKHYILIVDRDPDDSNDITDRIGEYLRRDDVDVAHEVHRVHHFDDYNKLIKKLPKYTMIFYDVNMEEKDGKQFLNDFIEAHPRARLEDRVIFTKHSYENHDDLAQELAKKLPNYKMRLLEKDSEKKRQHIINHVDELIRSKYCA